MNKAAKSHLFKVFLPKLRPVYICETEESSLMDFNLVVSLKHSAHIKKQTLKMGSM